MFVREKQTLLRIAEAATPAGNVLPPVDDALVDDVAELLRAQFGARGPALYRALLQALDLVAVPLHGQRTSALPLAERQQLLGRLNESNTAAFWLLRSVTAPIKMARTRTRALREALHMVEPPAPRTHTERWQRQIVDARALDDDEQIEVDCVVVGTGAGGAPLAHALASRGHAVLMLEAGAHFTRSDFEGDALARQARMYKRRGAHFALSNTPLLVPMGQTVGGSTTINSGTCYRVPERVQRRWVLEEGLDALGPGSLDAYYDKVEAMLGVSRATQETLGGCAEVIARGAEALGYAHEPLLRNAPECDGQGTCCFGCPTDAKRGTNVSYIPAALQRGAMVYSRARVDEVLLEGDRAVGVRARARREDGSYARITVRASAVVLAAGAAGTPAILLQNRIANSSGRVGCDLTLHPASYAWARFEQDIRGWSAIPQGYGVEEFSELGLRFEGAFLPLEAAAATLGHVGARWTELVESFDKLACFGFMISDTSRGRVTLGRDRRAQMRYWINDADRKQLLRGHAILARIYLAAGARAVYPGLRLFDTLRDEQDVERFEREAHRRLEARHIDVSAYHPLGSCRMGADPRRYVVGPDHETHDVRALFVCDGSAVPGPLGVNPQLTIMALGERAAPHVERRIEDMQHQRASRRRRAVGFAETMAGELLLCRGERAGERVHAEFRVHAARRGGGRFALAGVIDLPGVVRDARCTGTLSIRPLARRGTLTYELSFDDADGAPLRLFGEKSVGLLAPLRGMTELQTEISDDDGRVVASGQLRFDLRDLRRWLGSWRLA